MNLCPITYSPCGQNRYSAGGLKLLASGLKTQKDLGYTAEEQRIEAYNRADFTQLAGLSRDTKYDYSMEKIVKLINMYCTFPVIENIKLFKLVLFNFLVGNENMHLKNFSIINRDGKITLSPCYDLVNTTIEYKELDEEIALPVKGKKKKLTQNLLINYFGKERCELTGKSIESVLESISSSIIKWNKLIDLSFLSSEMKTKYHDLLNCRLSILKIQ